MARPLLPDDLWAEVAPLLPPPWPRPKGGRRPIENRAALTGILLVLRSGLQAEIGLRLRHELLASAAGLASGGRVEPPASRDLGAPAGGGCERLETGLLGQRVRSSQRRGPATGPNPMDRGKPGQSRHRVTDARGTPLGFCVSGVNRHDSVMMAEALDAIPPLRNPRRGRPRRRPDKLHADKADNAKARRRERRARGIGSRIARRGVESRETLGRHRWVV